ncbi:TolC family protein [Pseudohongiella acticola]|jgi:outer membrane protein, heavy metal efflux system|uniref:TolC family protein n=1 Tax=Pseudohongiella acticola TaxID=1524254 RepID=UPI0030EC87CC
MNRTIQARVGTRRWPLVPLLCTLLLLFVSNSYAADSISLDDAIVSTLTRSPELLAFNYALDAQDGRILQAGLSPRPELGVSVENVLGTGNARGLSGVEATVSIAWVLEGGLRQRRIDTARAGSQVLAAEADVMRLDAAAETARHYTEALAQQMRRDIADQALTLAEQTVAAIRARVDAGTTLTAELSRAQAALARRVLYREDIDHELEAAYHRLAAQWGELSPAFSHVEGDPLNLPTLAPFSKLVMRIDQNPELSRYLSEQRLHDAKLRLAQAQSQGLWRFNAGIKRMQSTSDTGFVAGITIPLNRGNNNQGRIAEARANLQRSVASEDAARVRIQTALLVLYLELEHSIHRVDALRDNVIPRFEKALSESRRAYELGRYSYLEWLQAQNDVLDSRSELAEASIQAHLRMIEIERLTGIRLVPTRTPE